MRARFSVSLPPPPQLVQVSCGGSLVGQAFLVPSGPCLGAHLHFSLLLMPWVA